MKFDAMGRSLLRLIRLLVPGNLVLEYDVIFFLRGRLIMIDIQVKS